MVTGAAKGIGRATALELAAHGVRLALCDKDADGLAALAEECLAGGAPACSSARVDVSVSSELTALAERVERELGPTFLLVNNAGVGVAGGFFDTELEDWEWLLRVNLWGAIHGVRAFGPAMRARGEGRIVNVASASGFCNVPTLTAYGTTKYALVGLSEALRAELLPFGVSVSAVCPGFVRSSIVQGARIRGAADAERERERLQAFYGRRGYAPEIVARAIVAAAKSGKALVPVTPEAWLLYALKRLVPSALPWLLRASERLYEK